MRLELQNALAQRRQVTIPATRWLIVLIVICLVLYILLAVIVAPKDYRGYHFISERGAITALSATFLAMASGFAGTSFFLSRRNGSWLSYFWLLITLGFGFFALDELLEFHEGFGHWIERSPIGATQTFRNWNDVIVIGYGIAAIVVLIYFLPEILRYPKFAEILTVAFAFYWIHTLIDSTLERTNVSAIFEESAKLFSSAFFAIAMFIGLLGVISSVTSRTE